MNNLANLNLTVLRRQLEQRKLVDTNIHNLAQSIFKPGSKVQWKLNGRDYYGVVIEIIGNPGRSQVRVTNTQTQKQRDLNLSDITGLVQEA
jgi:hypothetical protein